MAEPIQVTPIEAADLLGRRLFEPFKRDSLTRARYGDGLLPSQYQARIIEELHAANPTISPSEFRRMPAVELNRYIERLPPIEPPAAVANPKGQPPAARKVKRITTNELMILTLDQTPEAAQWTISQWKATIDRSRAAIQGTPTWKKLQAAHKLVEVDRMLEQERLRSMTHRGTDGGGADRRKQGRNLD